MSAECVVPNTPFKYHCPQVSIHDMLSLERLLRLHEALTLSTEDWMEYDSGSSFFIRGRDRYEGVLESLTVAIYGILVGGRLHIKLLFARDLLVQTLPTVCRG